MLRVCDGARTGDTRTLPRLLPLRRCGDLLGIRIDHLRTHARIEQLRPVHGHVVKLAGSPPDGAHQVGDDQGGRGTLIGVGSKSTRERVGDHGVQSGEVGVSSEDAQHRGGHVALAERRAPGGAGQQGGTPRPPVRLLRGTVALQEFGRGVPGRPRHEAGASQVLIGGCHRNTEVDEDRAARRTDDVRRLDVAVDDVGVMNGRDRGRQVVGEGGDAAQRHRPGDEDFRERGTLHVLRDNERLGGLGFRIDDVRDEGRAHGVHGARLALQALARLLRGGHRRVHGFEGDTRAAPVFGEPDRPRPARTEPTDQPVAAQFLAFFHALSLPVPSPICGHPRGVAPASSLNLTSKHTLSIHHVARTVQP